MCGITGYLNLDGRPAERRIVSAMCDAILHRGPDGEGVLVEGPVALGMRRLAIIDVDGGHQPIHSEDGQASIVFNGEVYNFESIRRELCERGRKFKTHSDTEAVVHLYADRGEACVDPLRGMFGFAIWDRSRRRLFIARDRIGKKPIHYFLNDRVFIFGSEIKSILVGMAHLSVPRPDVDREAIVSYMGYGYIPDPATIFRGIRRLPPAHHLSLEGGRVEIRRYWEPIFDVGRRKSDEDYEDEMESILEESVRLRMIADVPLGAYLSGGVDSSTTVGLMTRSASAPVKTFTIGFDNAEHNEIEYARIVAKHLGTDHHEFIVKPDAAGLIESIVRHFDEPFADSSAIPTYYVSKMAREKVTVVLSGDGGDELFAGYPRYLATKAGFIGSLPLGLRRILFGLASRMLPTGAFGKSALHNASLDADERYVHHVTVGVSEWHRDLFTDEFAESVPTTDPSPIMLDLLRKYGALDETTRRMAADIALYLPADIMVKVDRMSMMTSLEARAPLLDHKFVEFAARLPLDLKERNGESKYLLKRLARRIVPAEVIDRKKHGFSVPIAAWFNDAWMKDADEMILGPRATARGIFRKSTIERLVREHRSGRRDRSHHLWALMMLELWFRAYVDDLAFGKAT